MNYLFTSERLGFRDWKIEDLPFMAAMNRDERVMEFFPNTQTQEEAAAFIERLQKHFSEKGFCYFAVEILATQELIGFIGLAEQNYEAFFNPSVDIGWRLVPKFWGKGYATEGAKRCLDFAFEALQIKEIIAVAPVINEASINVMKKIGMQYQTTFEHPKLLNDERIKKCVLYSIK